MSHNFKIGTIYKYKQNSDSPFVDLVVFKSEYTQEFFSVISSNSYCGISKDALFIETDKTLAHIFNLV